MEKFYSSLQTLLPVIPLSRLRLSANPALAEASVNIWCASHVVVGYPPQTGMTDERFDAAYKKFRSSQFLSLLRIFDDVFSF
jgi:hypothetical protein